MRTDSGHFVFGFALADELDRERFGDRIARTVLRSDQTTSPYKRANRHSVAALKHSLRKFAALTTNRNIDLRELDARCQRIFPTTSGIGSCCMQAAIAPTDRLHCAFT